MKECLKYSINGNIIPAANCLIPLDCLSVTLGLSVFEATRIYSNNSGELFAFRFSDHISRLFRSMKILRIKHSFTKQQIIDDLIKLVEANNISTHAYIRLTIFFDQAVSGGSIYHPDSITPKLAIFVSEKEISDEFYSGINCCISSWRRISDNSIPPRIKASANYQNTRLAGYQALLDGYDNAILLNDSGKVSEAGESTIFIIRDGKIITPPVSAGILESITRDTIIKLARKQGIDIIERDVERTELYIADEMFLCNTAKIIRPVLSIDKYEIGDGKIGATTRFLQKKISRYCVWN